MNAFEKISANREAILERQNDLEKQAIVANVLRGAWGAAKKLGRVAKKHPWKTLGVAGGVHEIGSAGAGAVKRNRQMKTMARVDSRLGNVSPY